MSDTSLVAAVRAAATPQSENHNATIPLAQHESAVAAARAEGVSAGRMEGEKTGATAERTRVAAILDHESASGRETLARHFAFKTDMAPEAAQAALAAAPKETKAAETGLLAEMSKVNQLALGTGAGKDASDLSDVEKGALEAKRVLGIA